MSARPILTLLAVLLALGSATASPAVAVKAPSAPVITSAVVVDTRTVDLAWTPVKGADHYVVLSTSYDGALYTTATTARITALYPGDAQYFYVVAEGRKNQVLGTSETVYLATPPEGPIGTLGWRDLSEGYVLIWSQSGSGCVTQDLGRLAADGTYTSLGDGLDQGGPRSWTLLQGSGTTETYAVRCQGSGGLWSPWSEPPTVVTLG